MMLIDTSGLLCLLHGVESGHLQSVALYRAASRRITHSYILAEFVALAHARRLPRPAVLAFLEDLLSNPDIETIWVDESLHRRAMLLLKERLDKTYSLCDAVSFILMRDRRIDDALTTDRHFEQEGFRSTLR
jgi:predicted nucleic acid-binding protein